MIGKLSRLPVATRQALQQLACIGGGADVATLSIVMNASEPEAHALLWDALRQELVVRRESAYEFAHDRVQEAAYSSIPEQLRAEAHLRIGRLLRAHIPLDKREETIFEIAGQFNRGAALIASLDEREQVAELNLAAGKRAKASAAYASALTYLAAGTALLPEDLWERLRELTFNLELHRAECEFVIGALPDAERRLEMLSRRSTNAVEQAAVACLRIDLCTTLDDIGRAVSIGLEYLRPTGFNWSPHPTEEEARFEFQRIGSKLGNRTTEDFASQTLMTDPASLATVDVLTKCAAPAALVDVNLSLLLICRAVELSLECGVSDASCFAFAWLGVVAGVRFGDCGIGLRFAQLGYELVELRGLRRFQARAYFNFGILMAWIRPISLARDPLRRAFDAANKTGDRQYAAHTCYNIITIMLMAGDPLIDVQREAEHGDEFARKMGFGLAIDVTATQLALVRTLRGLTRKFGCFDDDHFQETWVEHRFSSNPALGRAECWYWIRKLQARFLAGDYPEAIRAASRARQLLWHTTLHPDIIDYHYYAALSRAASCGNAIADRRAADLEAVLEDYRQLQTWASLCAENFENRAALVGAEIARLEGREIDAERLYEQAIRSARANGFVQNEAIAYELAARFYETRGFEDFAHVYLRKARDGFLRWGADGKVRQLEEMYPHLRREQPPPDPTSTIATPVEHLDLATVIEVSQAVSGEIVFEKLIDTLMRTAIEQAGAERGVLVLSSCGEARIAAEARTSGDAVVVELRDDPLTAVALPELVLHYVVRTNKTVIIDDAAGRPPFAEDPYIRDRQARSILCLPLTSQAKLAGVLYLENSLARGVFAPARTAVLKLLASQATIALENTRLYRDLAEREAKIRRFVEANIIGVFVGDFDGRIFEANDAFLRIVGYDREDLAAGRINWKDLTPRNWRDRDAQWIEEHKRTGVRLPIEKEYLRKDGSRVPILLGSATVEEGGSQSVAFVLDLSERKQAEDALRNSEEALRRSEAWLVQAQGLSHTGNWVYDATTMQYLYWSDESYRIWGFDPLQGLPSREHMWRRIHPDDRDKVWDERQEALRQKRDFAAEFRILLPDGTVRYLEATTRHLFSSVGALVEAISTHVDVTERKRAQDEHERLRQLELDLAHKNRLSMMGELAASLAHEITQPIAAARNNARAALNFLSRQPADLGEVREALDCVVGDADRAGQIIDRIRDQIKKTPPRTDHFDLNEAIDEVIGLARSAIVKNGVSVQTRLTEGLPAVHGDRVQLQQVVLNLILNAVEAMSAVDEGVRELLLSTERSERYGVLVAVRDSGPGIDPERREHVFEAFYTTKSSGVGMGLSICRSIVGAHGGRLWVDENEPRGAVFRFTLPIAERNS